MVNLVKKGNADERKLSEALIGQLELSRIPNVSHYWFDFHGETHGDKFGKI